ncbi:rhodanese-like domain-containing protein [Enterococcus termitis]|jgi:rhodanese-related sulfurtransferase|uniref:Sulfurtransferase n=1 Tax=Enterococcus termitis TaxID=332950 RepID=A0A1E5GJH9_9ENTE|nr:rhodanese-like domain-containing protein [Enterococcus termitis]OEG12400.1 sulfurtransferase [Enterococcus termitis]
MFESMSVLDFTTLYNEDELNVIDIRETDAFLQKHLAHSISLPATVLPNMLDQLDKDKTYHIISNGGRRSETIAAFMTAKGYHAVHVIGGMDSLSL